MRKIASEWWQCLPHMTLNAWWRLNWLHKPVSRGYFNQEGLYGIAIRFSYNFKNASKADSYWKVFSQTFFVIGSAYNWKIHYLKDRLKMKITSLSQGSTQNENHSVYVRICLYWREICFMGPHPKVSCLIVSIEFQFTWWDLTDGVPSLSSSTLNTAAES